MKLIAIIDKHPVVRVGLRYFIMQTYESALIIESDSLSQFMKENSGNIPDVFIVGNTMELFNSTCQTNAEIRKENDSSQVIVFDDSPEYIKIVRS